MRVIGRNDVDAILADFRVDDYKKVALDALQAFSSESSICPPRLSIISPKYTSLHMPSLLNVGSDIVEKVVCVPNSGSNGLPASILILDAQTGEAKALMNASRLTAIRTASASLLSTTYIARTDPHWVPRHLLVFGSGEQSLQHICLHLDAFSSLCRVTVVVRSLTSRAQRLHSLLSSKYPNTICSMKLAIHEDIDLEADIICCCTPSQEVLFDYEKIKHIKKKQHLILIGSYKPTMREVDVDTFANSQLVMVDSKQDCLKEAGDLMAALARGVLQEKDIYELGSLYADFQKTDGQTQDGSDTRLSLYKSVGISVMDSTIALAVLAKAEKKGLGTVIRDYL